MLLPLSFGRDFPILSFYLSGFVFLIFEGLGVLNIKAEFILLFVIIVF